MRTFVEIGLANAVAAAVLALLALAAGRWSRRPALVHSLWLLVLLKLLTPPLVPLSLPWLASEPPPPAAVEPAPELPRMALGPVAPEPVRDAPPPRARRVNEPPPEVPPPPARDDAPPPVIVPPLPAEAACGCCTSTYSSR